MGKQKRGKPRRPVADWSIPEEIALLSYLDHCIKHSEVDFKQTVSLHFNELYTFDQCDRKLWALWNKIGPDHPPGISLRQLKDEQNIYKHGTACLHGLDEEHRRDIARATQQLKDEFVAEQLSTPARRLRSSSRLDRSQSVRSPSPSKSRGVRRKKVIPNKASEPRFESKSLTPSLVKQESRRVTSTPLEKPDPQRKRKRAADSEQHPSDKPNSLATLPITRTKHSTSKSLFSEAPKVVDDSFDGASTSTLSEMLSMLSEQEEDRGTLASTRENSPEEHNNDVSSRVGDGQGRTRSKETVRCVCGATEETAGEEGFWISCERCHVWQHSDCVDYFCEECLTNIKNLTQDNSKVNESVSKQDDTRLKSALREIEILRESLCGSEADLADKQREVEQLEKEKSRLNFAKVQRDEKHSWPMEDVIEGYLKTINNRNIELEARRRLSTFAKLKVDSRELSALRKIDEQFEQIHRNSQQIMYGYDEDKLPRIPDFRKDSNLKDLLSKALGIRDHKFKLSMEAIHPQALIRALTTVALREWIFETDFPQFGNDPPRVLDLYRTSILEQDGALALRNLDLAALFAHTNDETFQNHLIPRRATELVVKFSDILAPLFRDVSDNPSEIDWEGFATWGDEEEIWQARKYRLTEIFTTALTVKADSCLNLEDYEMVIFDPGTKFDKNTMVVETMEGMECSQGKFDGRFVKCCVQAAIYVYPRKALSSKSSVADAVIPMKNFVNKTERERATVRPLVKAVVVLTD